MENKLLDQQDYDQGKIDALKGRTPNSAEYPITNSYMKGYKDHLPTVRLHIPDMPRALQADAKAAAMKLGIPLKDWVKIAIRELLKNQSKGGI